MSNSDLLKDVFEGILVELKEEDKNIILLLEAVSSKKYSKEFNEQTLISSMNKYGAFFKKEKGGAYRLNPSYFLGFPYTTEQLKNIIESLVDKYSNKSFYDYFWNNLVEKEIRRTNRIPINYFELREKYYKNKYPEDISDFQRPPFTMEKLKKINSLYKKQDKLNTSEYEKHLGRVIDGAVEGSKVSQKGLYVMAANAQMYPIMNQAEREKAVRKYISAFNSYLFYMGKYNSHKKAGENKEAADVIENIRSFVRNFFRLGIAVPNERIEEENVKKAADKETIVNKIMGLKKGVSREAAEKKAEEVSVQMIDKLKRIQKKQEDAIKQDKVYDNNILEYNIKYLLGPYGGTIRDEMYGLLSKQSRDLYNEAKKLYDSDNINKEQLDNITQDIDISRSTIKKYFNQAYKDNKKLFFDLFTKYNPLTCKLLFISTLSTSPHLKLEEIKRMGSYSQQAGDEESAIISGFDTNYFEAYHFLDDAKNIITGKNLDKEQLAGITGTDKYGENSLRKIYTGEDTVSDKNISRRIYNHKLNALKKLVASQNAISFATQKDINKKMGDIKSDFTEVIGKLKEKFNFIPEQLSGFGKEKTYSFISVIDNYLNKVINNPNIFEAYKSKIIDFSIKANEDKIKNKISELEEKLKQIGITEGYVSPEIKTNTIPGDDESEGLFRKSVEAQGVQNFYKNVLKSTKELNKEVEEEIKKIDIVKIIKTLYDFLRNNYIDRDEEGLPQQNSFGGSNYSFLKEIKSNTSFEGMPVSSSQIAEEDFKKLSDLIASLSVGLQNRIQNQIKLKTGIKREGAQILENRKRLLVGLGKAQAFKDFKEGFIKDKKDEIKNMYNKLIKDENDLDKKQELEKELKSIITRKIIPERIKPSINNFFKNKEEEIEKQITDEIDSGKVSNIHDDDIQTIAKKKAGASYHFKGKKVALTQEIIDMAKKESGLILKHKKPKTKIVKESSRYLANIDEKNIFPFSFSDVLENWFFRSKYIPPHLLDLPSLNALAAIYKPFMQNIQEIIELTKTSEINNIAQAAKQFGMEQVEEEYGLSEKLNNFHSIVELAKKRIVNFYKAESLKIPDDIVATLNEKKKTFAEQWKNLDLVEKLFDTKQDMIKLNSYLNSTMIEIGNKIVLEMANYFSEFAGIGGIREAMLRFGKKQEKNLPKNIPESMFNNVYYKEEQKDSLLNYIERL